MKPIHRSHLLSFLCLILVAPARAYQEMPPIGIIDFYGLRTVSEAEVRQALQITEGDSVSANSKTAQKRLEAIPGVEQARLEFTCCEAGKTILYVGIREKGSPALRFRKAPTGKISLPPEIVAAGDRFLDSLMQAVKAGDVAEDQSKGYALNHDPRLREIEERYIVFAHRYLRRLRLVLHNSSDSKQRALAAQVIAYASDKHAVIADLVWAMRDPSAEVRNNAMRALAVMARFALGSPDQHLHIPMEPFVALLNSIDWTSRNKASLALGQLTVHRDTALLSKLREEALPALVEMSRWESPGHAGPPFFILGRVGGVPEDEIEAFWNRGDREGLIQRVVKAAKTK